MYHYQVRICLLEWVFVSVSVQVFVMYSPILCLELQFLFYLRHVVAVGGGEQSDSAHMFLLGDGAAGSS